MAIAAVVLAAIDLLVFFRLQAITSSHALDDCFLMERQVSTFEPRRDVRVVIFGNSHALAGLRPPCLAAALSAPNRDFFNLSMPSGTPHEMRLLAQRFLPKFPGVRLAVCALDPMLFRLDEPYRVRYWTRTWVSERWADALQQPTFDAGVAEMAGLLFPFADDATPIKTALAIRPRQVAENLLGPELRPTGYFRALCRHAYPWGYPPVWSDPAFIDQSLARRIRNTPAALNDRMDYVEPSQMAIARQMRELEALTRWLEARGIRVMFVETPYRARMERAMRHAKIYPEYRRTLDAYMARNRHSVLVPPMIWRSQDFYVMDHLNRHGAMRLAHWLAKRAGLEFRRALADENTGKLAL